MIKKFVALAILPVMTAVGAAAIVGAWSKAPTGPADEELESPAVLRLSPMLLKSLVRKGQGRTAKRAKRAVKLADGQIVDHGVGQRSLRSIA